MARCLPCGRRRAAATAALAEVPQEKLADLTWAAMALGIMAWGPGRISSDYLVRGFLGLPESIR
jgi:hypothetical protein